MYPTPNIIRMIRSRRIRLAEHAACMEEMIHACKTLDGNTGRKRPLKSHRCRWEDNIKMGIKEVVPVWRWVRIPPP
jgi:hypothetical protein